VQGGTRAALALAPFLHVKINAADRVGPPSPFTAMVPSRTPIQRMRGLVRSLPSSKKHQAGGAQRGGWFCRGAWTLAGGRVFRRAFWRFFFLKAPVEKFEKEDGQVRAVRRSASANRHTSATEAWRNVTAQGSSRFRGSGFSRGPGCGT